MRFGEAPIGDESAIDTMLARRWSHRRPVPRGVEFTLTVLFWMVWVYLVLPLASLVLWIAGVQLFAREMIDDGGYVALRDALASYSVVLLVIVLVLTVWIVWNVWRYGGSRDRRTVKRPEVSEEEVLRRFQLDATVLDELRASRSSRIDVDPDGCVVVLETSTPEAVGA